MRASKVSALSAAVGLTLLSAGAAGPASPAPPSGLIVQGTIHGSTAAPVAGATVLLYAPPTLASPGPAKEPLLASGTTDTRGTFALAAAAPSSLQEQAAANGGWLNLDLLVLTKGFYLYRSVPRHLDPTIGAWKGTEALKGGALDLGPLALAPDQPGVVKRSGRLPQTLAAAAAASACVETTVSTKSFKIATTVGELHNRAARARFAYGHPASSIVDVAMAPGLSGPGWSLVPGSGSTSVVANLGPSPVAVSVTTGYARSITSAFVYQERFVFNTCSGYRRVVKATSWVGGLGTRPVDDPSASCSLSPYNAAPRRVAYPAGGMLARTASLAYRFPQAANISVVTGTTYWVSARSGFAPSVWARWSFSTPGVLCGDTGAPGASQRVFAG